MARTLYRLKIRLMLCCTAALIGSGVSGDAASAQDLITVHRLPVARAVTGVQAAIAACRAKGFATTAAFVDTDGGMQAVVRGDGAGIQTIESAVRKATTSAVFGLDSGYWVDRQQRGEPISPLLERFPNLLLARGGVTIKIRGETVGGIAVAGAPGGEIDEACAKAGLAALLAAN